MANGVCHATPNFQLHFKLKFFQQKLQIFSNKRFFSIHLIQCVACVSLGVLVEGAKGLKRGIYCDRGLSLLYVFFSYLKSKCYVLTFVSCYCTM